jgi:hypothetical protein
MPAVPAGANVDGTHYMPHITSYDYDAPISEAGDYGQPGIGGDSKYHVSVRALSRLKGFAFSVHSAAPQFAALILSMKCWPVSHAVCPSAVAPGSLGLSGASHQLQAL